MQLPFANFLKKKVPSEYFLALLFRDEKIHAVVFEQLSGRIQVIGEGKAQLPASLERASDEMLLDAADKAISLAEQNLPNGITTHKTVFGVKETWVEDAHITKDYLSRLKIISDQLDLKPIGFLVFPEAIAHLLQKEEGAPVSAILIEAGKQNLTITLFRAGRIVGTKEVQQADSLTTTVENALLQFENIEILPSKIILFDTADANIEKEFLSHKWNKTLPFLHVPQITTLPQDFDTRAVLFGTATQMGLDAIDLVKQPLKKTETFFEEEKKVEEPVVEESTTDEEAQPHPSPLLKGEGNQEENVTKDSSEDFGFVKNTDVAENEGDVKKSSFSTNEEMDNVTADIPEEEKEDELAGEAPGFSKAGAIFFEGAKKTFQKISKNLPKGISFPKLPGNNNKLLFLAPLLVILILLGLFFYIFGVHATVSLVLSPKVISQDETITFTTNGPSDPSNNLVAATTISVDEEGKVSGNATGTKDVGNPAKGTVTIFNIDTQTHTLTAGTVITCIQNCSGALQFTLDNNVTVASGSSDPTNPSSGTADVNVTASDIGTDYNLPSGAKFSIPDTALLAAKNANALSGGTKQTETVVSQKDLDNLTNQLTTNLTAKAKSDLSSKVGNDEVILPDFTKTTAGITNFDKKVGDQTQSINLDGTITFETIAYKKSDIASYSKDALSGKLPSNMQLSPQGITYTAKNITTKDGTTKATLTMNAGLIPILDTKSLQTQIAGKSFADARDILSNVPQFSDATFTLSPSIFFLPNSLPRLSGNIKINITTNE